MSKEYDIEPILTREEFKANRDKVLAKEKNTKKRYVLKRWVKNTLFIILGAFIGIAIYQLATTTETKQTPVGSYTCSGGIIKVCTGSQEVADYLGV